MVGSYTYKKRFMVINAKSGIHILLFEGKIKVIGSVAEGNRLDLQGNVVCFQKMILNYGTEFTDTFYFENGILVYSDISFKVEDYISETYQRLISKGKISSEEFLTGLLDVFVFTEMGF